MRDESVGDLTGDLRHELADAGDEHPGESNSGEVAPLGSEVRGHDRVGVELAAEVELLAGQPGVPDGTNRQDVLAHAPRWMRPLHREAVRDVRPDLTPEAQYETTLRIGLKIPGRVGHGHRATSESHCNGRTDIQLAGVLRREQQRQKWIVGHLRRPRTGVARCLDLPHLAHHVGEITQEVRIHLHRPNRTVRLSEVRPSEVRVTEG
jgi:hypothetical protein